MSDDRTGQQFGNYRVVRPLGRGGFAEVYLGEHIHINTYAAIKIVYTKLTKNEIKSFYDEARTVARLKHPNIVQLLDFGVEDNIPYLIMEYAPNGCLRQRHPEGIPLPLSIITQYIKHIVAALQYVHNQKLIHRDIKPPNMLLGADGEVLLSDFGIAVVSQTSPERSPQNEAGTVFYMAPEQLQGKPRLASDQYALGVVVYEWITGSRPFNGSSYLEVATQHILVPPPLLREKFPAISSAIEEVVLRALSKEPKQRFESVQAFADALEQACQPPTLLRPILLSQVPVQFIPTNPLPAPLPQSNPIVDPKEAQAVKQGSSRRAVLLGLGGLIAGSGIILTLSRIFGNSKVTPSPTATPTSKVIYTPTATPFPVSAPLYLGDTLYTYDGDYNGVYAVGWSPDSKRIASGGFDKIVQVWDATTGNNRLSCTGHASTVWVVVWNPVGKRIASAGSYDNTVKIWDATTGNNPLTYTGHKSAVFAVAWSPDGTRIVSGEYNGIVQVWDATTGNNPLTYTGHNNTVWAVAWSPNGHYIASAGNGTVQVWDAATGSKTFTYTGHKNTVCAVAWSHDSKRIASGDYDGIVQVWDATTGSNPSTYAGHKDVVWTVTWSPNGLRIASGSKDKTVHVWEAATGDLLLHYNKHFNQVRAVAWSPDGMHIASASTDYTVQVWQAI